MSKDNVVRPNFGSKPKTVDSFPHASDRPVIEIDATSLRGGVLGVMNEMLGSLEPDVSQPIHWIMKSLEIEGKLNALGVQMNSAKVQEQVTLLKSYPEDQLFGFLTAATDADLSRRPSFYCALVIVANTRHADEKEDSPPQK